MGDTYLLVVVSHHKSGKLQHVAVPCQSGKLGPGSGCTIFLDLWRAFS